MGGHCMAIYTYTQSFTYAGSTQNFTIPATVSSVKIQAWGAGGGAGGGNVLSQGGAGGYSEGILGVTPGQVLTIVTGQGGVFRGTSITFGGGGAGGIDNFSAFEGSSGGGRSAVVANGLEILTAAGGGGASSSPASPYISHGGSGGCTTGVAAFINGAYPASAQARGGTQVAGGAGGVATAAANNGTAGAALQGGNGGSSGATNCGGGGGGGGGRFGGGGGCGQSNLIGVNPLQDSAGAGGSSYIGGVTSGITLCSPQITSTTNVPSPNRIPPNASDPNYIAGVGVGGYINVNNNGGDGLVVLTFDVTVTPLTITKQVSAAAAKVGDVLTYTLTIQNKGEFPASSVVITDPIPSGTSYVSGSTTANVAFTGDPTSTINLTNPIGVGETITITYQVTVNTLPTPNPIPNTATMDYTVTPVSGQAPINTTTPSNTVTTLVFDTSRGVLFV